MEELQLPEIVNVLFMLLSAGLIVPLTQWLKKKFDTIDFPIGVEFVSGLLSFGVVYGLCRVFIPDASIQYIVTASMFLWKANNLGHATFRSIKPSEKTLMEKERKTSIGRRTFPNS